VSRDLAAVRAAIIDAPSAVLPRLAFADLLEENGDEPRADFMRAQVEIFQAGLRYNPPSDKTDGVSPPVDHPLDQVCESLLRRHGQGWVYDDLADMPAVLCNVTPGWAATVHRSLYGQHVAWSFELGLPYALRCSPAFWLDFGQPISKCWPITTIVITATNGPWPVVRQEGGKVGFPNRRLLALRNGEPHSPTFRRDLFKRYTGHLSVIFE
jgi:uncharacterized protein (TIGR02996 family)